MQPRCAASCITFPSMETGIEEEGGLVSILISHRSYCFRLEVSRCISLANVRCVKFISPRAKLHRRINKIVSSALVRKLDRDVEDNFCVILEFPPPLIFLPFFFLASALYNSAIRRKRKALRRGALSWVGGFLGKTEDTRNICNSKVPN